MLVTEHSLAKVRTFLHKTSNYNSYQADPFEHLHNYSPNSKKTSMLELCIDFSLKPKNFTTFKIYYKFII